MLKKIRDIAAQNMFFLVQECIIAAFVACILRTIWIQFPIDSFLIFLGPVALGAYGIKKWGDAKELSNANTQRPVGPEMGAPRIDRSGSPDPGIPIR